MGTGGDAAGATARRNYACCLGDPSVVWPLLGAQRPLRDEVSPTQKASPMAR